MLWGMRPHLQGPIKCDSISWSSNGYYVVMVSPQVAGATEGGLSHELHIAPNSADWDKPWSQQRMHLLGVSAWASSGIDGALVYRVTMDKHEATGTAQPIVDPDGLDPDVPPSGPTVNVELPRLIHVEVPSRKSDVVFKYKEAFVNPPLIPNAFKLNMKPGVPIDESRCE
jgi:hypothetical protein